MGPQSAHLSLLLVVEPLKTARRECLEAHILLAEHLISDHLSGNRPKCQSEHAVPGCNSEILDAIQGSNDRHSVNRHRAQTAPFGRRRCVPQIGKTKTTCHRELLESSPPHHVVLPRKFHGPRKPDEPVHGRTKHRGLTQYTGDPKRRCPTGTDLDVSVVPLPGLHR